MLFVRAISHQPGALLNWLLFAWFFTPSFALSPLHFAASNRLLAFSVVIHMKKPLNYRCHMGTYWIIPVSSLHALYVAALVGFTGAIRHVEFRFDELKDLWRGILVSASSVGTLSSRFYKAL